MFMISGASSDLFKGMKDKGGGAQDACVSAQGGGDELDCFGCRWQ
jgi:hypothetical protein